MHPISKQINIKLECKINTHSQDILYPITGPYDPAPFDPESEPDWTQIIPPFVSYQKGHSIGNVAHPMMIREHVLYHINSYKISSQSPDEIKNWDLRDKFANFVTFRDTYDDFKIPKHKIDLCNVMDEVKNLNKDEKLKFLESLAYYEITMPYEMFEDVMWEMKVKGTNCNHFSQHVPVKYQWAFCPWKGDCKAMARIPAVYFTVLPVEFVRQVPTKFARHMTKDQFDSLPSETQNAFIAKFGVIE
jgi:hypothetical protein